MILHIMTREKFTQPFIDFINENFDVKNHKFIVINKNTSEYKLNLELNNVDEINGYNLSSLKILYFLNKSDKIIIHGLNSKVVIFLLFFQFWILKKTYWIIWGADLYGYLEKKITLKDKILELMKLSVIKRIGHVIGSIEGEYKLAKKWYGINAQWHHCFVYPTKFFIKSNIKMIKADTKNILIGNSASKSNEHLSIFNKLKDKNLENIKIYVPLSYGDKEYANEVISKGQEYFGSSFIPLVDFMPLHEYNNLLANIDIALFAHKRQQAINNIVVLLGLGKKVYIRSDITSWDFFNKLEIKIFDIDKLKLTLLDDNIKINNIKIVTNYFSEENLVKQFREIL